MIIPAILTDDMAEAQQRLDIIASLSPPPPAVHIDIIDGFFADNLTIETGVIRELNRHEIPFDVHLMAVEPADFLEELTGVGGLRSVIAQIERLSDQRVYVDLVKQLEGQVGFSLDLYTPLEAVEEKLWPSVAVLQVMGGVAGEQGQDFHPSALTVIRQARQLRTDRRLNFRIMADIAMEPETIKYAREAGADDFVVGSYLNQDAQRHWHKLMEATQ